MDLYGPAFATTQSAKLGTIRTKAAEGAPIWGVNNQPLPFCEHGSPKRAATRQYRRR
jgi:hypothetical protein